MTEIVYTANDSFTVPAGVSSLTLEAWAMAEARYIKATLAVTTGDTVLSVAKAVDDTNGATAGFTKNAAWLIYTFHAYTDEFDYPVTGGSAAVAPAVLVSTTWIAKPAGSGTGSIARLTYVPAEVTPNGSGSGSALWTGSASGVAPALLTPQGTSSGTTSYVGSATGSKNAEGASTGTAVWLGSTSGSTPIIAPTQGNTAGAISYLGLATGTAEKQGTAVSSWVFVGSSQGSSELNGVASGQWVYQGITSGTAAFSHNVTVTARLLPRRWTASISPRRWSGTSQSDRRWEGKLL